VTFLHAIRSAAARFGVFAGTATRPEFWWFALFVALGHLALNSLNLVTPAGTVYLGASLSGAFGVVTLLPLLAVTVRRLHDAGRGAVELLWLLLPIAGLVVLIVHLGGPTRRGGIGTPGTVAVGTPIGA
jgi:uncharacterized membrane protein YhaH (DUF805 family)